MDIYIDERVGVGHIKGQGQEERKKCKKASRFGR
jgi:hypothetical protein